MLHCYNMVAYQRIISCKCSHLYSAFLYDDNKKCYFNYELAVRKLVKTMLLSSAQLSNVLYLPDAPQILEKIFRKFSGIRNFVLKNEIHSAFDIREESLAP